MTPSCRWTVTWACIGTAGYLALNALYTAGLSMDVYADGKMVENVTYASQWEPWRPYFAVFVGMFALLGWIWCPEPDELSEPPSESPKAVARYRK